MTPAAGLECLGCHRALKRPSPTGYGPTCARKRGLTPGKPRRSTVGRRSKPAKVPPAADALPGQTELDLFFHQPSLDSI
ncbi:hypothetical protein ACFC8N_42645 [Streptomyces sp. NPDC055966]|uniref:hypothetical protein n=1 Tax=Streptomyces sp. NPDC055966 TaxID=3345669 RepID=UPI0035DD4AB1